MCEVFFYIRIDVYIIYKEELLGLAFILFCKLAAPNQHSGVLIKA